MLATISKLYAPYKCIFCGLEGALVCGVCEYREMPTKVSKCFLCNTLTDAFKTCTACRNSTQVSGAVIATQYENEAKKLVHLLKYKHAREASEYIGNYIVKSIDMLHPDVITAVPTSPKSYRRRSFNHAELITRQVAKHKMLQYGELLGRYGEKHQVGASREERFRQIKKCFYAKNQHLIQNKHILVVDDVLTTGATLSECGKTLMKAGASSVWGAIFVKN
jgi:competence protein ComFC